MATRKNTRGRSHRKHSKKHNRSHNKSRKSGRGRLHKSAKNRKQSGGFVSGCQLATVNEPGFKIGANTGAGIPGLSIPEAKTYIYRGDCGADCGGGSHP
jgi:hypothetical protein